MRGSWFEARGKRFKDSVLGRSWVGGLRVPLPLVAEKDGEGFLRHLRLIGDDSPYQKRRGGECGRAVRAPVEVSTFHL